jgi:hypothetical protein
MSVPALKTRVGTGTDGRCLLESMLLQIPQVAQALLPVRGSPLSHNHGMSTITKIAQA